MKTVSEASVSLIMILLCKDRQQLKKASAYWNNPPLDNGFSQEDIDRGRETYRIGLEHNTTAIREFIEASGPESIKLIDRCWPAAADVFEASSPSTASQGDAP